MKRLLGLILAASLVAACSRGPMDESARDVDALAREYLLLELAMGMHDAAHVDAYFGPEEIRSEAADAELSLADIAARSAGLAEQLRAGTQNVRTGKLIERLRALDTRITLNEGTTLPFDDESRRLFGATAPDYDAAHFDAILREIDALLPGDGSLPARVNAFRDRFIIPPERVAAVMDAAIAECRRRTLLFISLPADESFELEFVNDKPWSGYNWYQGNAQSLIQINTDLPIHIDRAVDLGCHEGYPGHHTFNALLEKNLVQDRGWLEYSLYPLFSPQSLIAEGSANYGIDLAFPGDERLQFERDVLFPLAGLDPAGVTDYYALLELLDRLDYAENEAARDYLDGTTGREQAVQWLVDYALVSRQRAEQRVDFFDTYRSYIINYNLGQDLVRDYVERDTQDLAARWLRFEQLLSSPMSATDLQ